MATKRDICTEAGKRLGTASTDFVEGLLSGVFDMVMAELAQLGALDLLGTVRNFTLTAAQQSYDLVTDIGFSSLPTTIDDEIIVSSYGWPEGRLIRVSDESFNHHILLSGSTTQQRPKMWRLFPNARTVQFFPIPDTTIASGAQLHGVLPPTVLGIDATVTEVRDADIPVLIAGIQFYAAEFLQHAITQRGAYKILYDEGVRRLRTRVQSTGRVVSTVYRDL